MSLRYMSRSICQVGGRLVQGMKEQASKGDSTLRSIKESVSSASSSSSSSKQGRRFSGAVDSGGFRAAKNYDKAKQREESFRTVMYLSCWGPN